MARKKAISNKRKEISKYLPLLGVGLLAALILLPLLWPKNDFQKAKTSVIKNNHNFEARLVLAAAFLENNQFEKAEKEFLAVANQDLSTKAREQLAGLWQKKLQTDPKEIKRQAEDWEKIMIEKPNYRDGYLQLAIFYYQLYETKKAEEALQKALALDPNYELAQELRQKFEGR